MEQQIRFCTTSDGVRIATAILADCPHVYRAGAPYWAFYTIVSPDRSAKFHD